MSEEAASTIFEEYTQANNPEQKNVTGTGLGLSICKGFVNLMGGEINVKSTIDKGSIFSFWFPKVSKDKAAIAEVQKIKEIDYSIFKNLKIAACDDDEFNLGYLEMLLNKKTEYYLFDSGIKLIEFAKNNPVDIIFTDLHMPEMDGYDVLTQIRKFNKTVLIIALTAQATTGTQEELASLGFDNYLAKPFLEHEFYEFLQKIKTQLP